MVAAPKYKVVSGFGKQAAALSMVPLRHMAALLEQLLALDRVIKRQPLLENEFQP